MDQRLVVQKGLTWSYQMVRTQILMRAILAAAIGSHQDSRTHSSQVIISSLSQITRCLDSVSDNYQAGK